MAFIAYESWVQACDMYFSADTAYLCSAMRTYPLGRMDSERREWVRSRSFFEEQIQSKVFLQNPQVMCVVPAPLRKRDGSWRANACYLSPVLRLVMDALAFSFEREYVPQRPAAIRLYTGCGRGVSLYNYAAYEKELVAQVAAIGRRYEYYVRTDVTELNAHASLNLLTEKLALGSTCPVDGEFTDRCQTMAAALQRFGGTMPIVHTSLSQYLMFDVFFDRADVELYAFFGSMGFADGFEVVRNGDDLYLFFNLGDDARLQGLLNTVIQKTEEVYAKDGLRLNRAKCDCGRVCDLVIPMQKPLRSRVARALQTDKLPLAGPRKAAVGVLSRSVNKARLAQHAASGSWSEEDTARTVGMLVACGFSDDTLLSLLKGNAPSLYDYCRRYCVEGVVC